MQKEIVILINSPDIEDPTSFYRAAGPFGHLRKHTDLRLSFVMTNEISWPILNYCDICFFQRPSSNKHLEAITLAQEMGKPVWVDYDDDLLSVPTDNPAYRIYGQHQIQINVIKILQMANVVTASTQGLVDNWKRRGVERDDYVVIENALDLDLFPWGRKPKGNPRNLIMWRGSPSHMRDVLSVSSQIIETAAGTEGFEFEFVGDRLWFLTDRMNPDKIKLTPPISITAFFRYIHEREPKVFIAPLIDTSFNRAKSNIAWLESTWAGSIMVAPKLPEWDQPGVLSYSNPQHFYDLLKKAMLMEKDEQLEMREKSWSKILEVYTLDVQNKKREQIIRRMSI